MKSFVMLFAAASLFYLSGCAVLDLSSLDTAVPLKPGHVEAAVYLADGLDLSSAVVIEQVQGSYEQSHDEKLSASGQLLGGLKANIGLFPGTELMLRAYESDGNGNNNTERWERNSTGYKAGLKIQCRKKENTYISLAPAINIVQGVSEHWDIENGDLLWKNLYDAYGFELQTLYSEVVSKYLTFTGVVRANVDFYSEDYHGVKYGTYTIFHYGMRGNMMISVKPLFLILELGGEYVPVVKGNSTFLPGLGFGVGLRF